jgi:hypothetical protein
LKRLGFVLNESQTTLELGKGKQVVNVAPLTIALQSIDNWIDKTRYEVAAALRKRTDDLVRKQIQAKEVVAVEAQEGGTDRRIDHDSSRIKVRIEGKKKLHELVLHADDRLSSILDKLPIHEQPDKEVQIICVAKRLIVNSSETGRMEQSLRELGLCPSATLVVSLGGKEEANCVSRLSERVSFKKKMTTGSHTMQSVGIYSKDDNAKAELIDGGGGVWYEHDVSDNEDAVQADRDDSISLVAEDESDEADTGDASVSYD